MTVHELTATQAWTSGARMWVAPTPANSLWSRRLDWYLNFRMSKGLTHQSQSRSPQLEGILERIQWKLSPSTDVSEKPLLIAAGLWLPCDWILVLETLSSEKNQLSPALEQLASAWSDLGEPKVRIFAPTQFPKDGLAERWSKQALPKDFEFVLE